MRSLLLRTTLVLAAIASLSVVPSAEKAVASATTGTGPAFKAIGPMTFGPDGLLFAADAQSAAIFALELGQAAQGGAQGAKAIAGIDKQIAALLGTDVREITITDLVVHPQTHNAYLSVMRGQGAAAMPALLRVDGAGRIEMIGLDKVKFSKVDLPNAPAAAATGQ